MRLASVLRIISFVFFVFMFWAWAINAEAADPNCEELALLDWRDQESYFISTVVNADLIDRHITPYCLEIKTGVVIDTLIAECSIGETYADSVKHTVSLLDVICSDFLKEFESMELPYHNIPRPQ